MRDRRYSLGLFLGGLVSALACDGSLTSGVVTNQDGGPAPIADGAAEADVAAEVDAAAEPPAPDARLRSDAPRDLPVASLPEGVPPPRQLVSGPARLVGGAVSACTNQVPPPEHGDRWCAFTRPAPTGMATELWVIDVTASLAGPPPACDGSSLLCLRMTANLWTESSFGGPTQAEAHRFDGDTLIFHTPGSSMKDEPFRGPIWAWRPGWPQPRMLVANGFACYAHDKLPLVFCVDDLAKAPPNQFDLRVGSVAPPEDGLLPVLDRARLLRGDSQQAFSAWFSDDGQYVAYSTAASDDAEVAGLRVVKLDERATAPPREILADTMAWQLSNDGRKVYYLSKYSEAEGTLMMADFPSGESPRQLARRTGRYVVLDDGSGVDRGVGYFVTATGRFLSEYWTLPRPDQLPVSIFRFKDLLEDFHLSPSLRYTGYAKVDMKDGFNAYLVRNDTRSECILSAEIGRPAFEYMFLASDGLVFWEEVSDDDTTIMDGWFGDPDGCRRKQRYASRIGFYVPVRDDGLVFGDDYDGDLETVTLKYAPIANGRDWPTDGPVKVRESADLPLSILRPAMGQVVFTVSQGAAAEAGLYVFGLPFGPKK